MAALGHRLHQAGAFLLTVAILLSLITIGIAWRLSRGPLDLDFLKERAEAALNQGISPLRVTAGDLSIAWAGFSHGRDQPLILRVTDLTVEETSSGARVHIPLAEAGLSMRALLTGRVLPRSITLDGARLVLIRQTDGTVGFDLGGVNDTTGANKPSPLSGLLAVLGSPPGTDLKMGGGRLSQLSAVSIDGARLTLDDRLLGVTWSAPRADIDLSRHAGGGMDGQARIVLALGGQTAALTASFTLAAAARSAHVKVHLSPVIPNAFAETAPFMAPLAALNVAVTADGEADLGPDLEPVHMRLNARAGPGTINAGGGAIRVRGAEFAVSGTMREMTLESGELRLQPAEGAPVTTLKATGVLTRRAGNAPSGTGAAGTVQTGGGSTGAGQINGTDPPDDVSIALHVTLDRFAFADLHSLWPPDISPFTWQWITQNIQSGTAHDGKADFVLETTDTLARVKLVQATATLEGENVTATWLPDVPPVEQVRAHLVLPNPDKVDIEVRSGQQKVTGAESIAVRDGHITVTGLSAKDQVATIKFDASGSVPSAIALLKEPRLRLLDQYPMDLRSPAGEARMSFQLVVPLELKLRFDDVSLHGSGTLSKVHLSGIAGGKDLDDAAVALDVDTNHLTVKGTGRVAGIAANIDGMMDFRSGPPSQVIERITVAAKTTARGLADSGLDASGVLAGDIGLNAILSEYRSGDGDLTVDADLTQAVLTAAPLAWQKPAGIGLIGSARLALVKDKLTGIDNISFDGPGMQARGAVTVAAGKPDTVRVDRLLLGRSDLRGTIRLPANGPIAVDLSGPVLDLSAKLLEKPLTHDRPAQPPPTPAWSIRGGFDQVILAHGQVAGQVTVSADNDGNLFQAVTLDGKGGSGKPFSMRLGYGQPGAGAPPGRRVTVNAQDAGRLLKGLGITETLQDGTLSVTGEFDDSTPAHVLSGTLEIDDFRIAHAVVLGKLLQSLTLYGLVDALGGPGLNFNRLIAPFRLSNDTIVLHDVRAFSPSLGLTATGRMDRAGERINFEGTVVPAYMFNSLLGQIPLIGGLFSPERGGGLIAMNYSVHGPTDNPTVTANPLSALTPGILRGMFGLFNQGPLDRAAPGGNVQTP